MVMDSAKMSQVSAKVSQAVHLFGFLEVVKI